MSEKDYKSLIEKMTWSYSRIDCFNTCRYKWFLRYIDDPLGVKSEPMFYSSYGSFIHELLEGFYNGKYTKDELPTIFLSQFGKRVRGERPPGGIAQKYIQSGYEYLKSFEPFPYKMLGVEKRVAFSVGGNRFIGFIDFLGEKDGELYIVDNKSRDLKPRSKRKKPTIKDMELDEMLRQLYLYAAAVKEEYGKFPKALCFNCFKSGVFIEEPFVKERFYETLEWAEKTIDKITNATEFYPNLDYFFCRWLCEYRNECCYVDRGDKE